MSNPTRAAHVEIGFVTIGALLMVNTAVIHSYLSYYDVADASAVFSAFLFSGMTVFALGFSLGTIGRPGRHAELPADVSGVSILQPAVVVGQPAAVSPVVALAQPAASDQTVAISQPGLAPLAQVALVGPTPRLHRDTEVPKASGVRAVLDGSAGRPEDGNGGFARSIALHATYARAFQARGEQALLNQCYAAAAADFEQVRALDPSSWVAAYKLGQARHGQGEIDAASRAYEQFLALAPLATRAQIGDQLDGVR